MFIAKTFLNNTVIQLQYKTDGPCFVVMDDYYADST